ncbi:hypothetical protein [Streptomyces sp. NPDC020917]|uniref:hypothetical protein n=1 Tax=Streptomyces sp. NPDC020917 TaxID=3365102 RepID=UPI00379AB730
MRTVRAAASAAAAAVLLSLAACGPLGTSASSGSATVPPRSPAAAPARTSTAQAVQALDLVQKQTDHLHSVSAEETLSIGDRISAKARVRLAWGSGGPLGTMTMTFTGGRQIQTLRSLGMSATMEARYLPDGVYTHLSGAQVGAAGGKHWAKFTYAEMGMLAGDTPDFGKDFFQSNNPVRSVDLLLSAGDLREVGRETVRGVAATHYTGTLDVAALTSMRAPHLSASQLAAEKRALQAQGVTTETLDLWVSADHLPLKVHKTERTGKGLETGTIYYTAFGVPVRVQAPPASDTMGVAGLRPQATRA